MAPDELLQSVLDDHQRVAQATPAAVRDSFARLVSLAAHALRGGNKLMFFGNGGIAAIALTTDTSALTAIGNDLGFDRLFARQIEALGRAGDVAVGITTSGRSRNVILGLQAARERGLVAAALAGGDGGELPGLADPLLIVPSQDTARIQEMHITLGHALCAALERDLGMG